MEIIGAIKTVNVKSCIVTEDMDDSRRARLGGYRQQNYQKIRNAIIFSMNLDESLKLKNKLTETATPN